MIVIEGRSRKSVVLENLINNDIKNDSVIILNNVDGTMKWIDNLTHTHLVGYPTYQKVIECFEEDYERFEGFDWIAFYVNADKKAIEKFKELDRKYSQNFIVTIQTDYGDAEMYFV